MPFLPIVLLNELKKRPVTNVIVGDSLSYSYNQKFSTPDQENNRGNCATRYRTAGCVSSPTLMVRTPTLRKLLVMDTLHGSAGNCRGYL